MITSLRNPRVRQARSLRQRKFRRESGLFLVEGIRQVGDALLSGFEVDLLFYAPDVLTSPFAYQVIEAARRGGVEVVPVSPRVFASLAERQHPQGILAVVRWPRRVLDAFSPENAPWVVAAVAPQDPGNIGTLLRTMDAVGAGLLLLLDGGADPTHPTAVRASLGALFWVPVVQTEFAAFAAWSAGHGYAVYGTSARGAHGLEALRRAHPPYVLLLGSERTGLTPEQQAVCKHMVRLPMRGHVSSLNLGVAAGVCLYAMLGDSA